MTSYVGYWYCDAPLTREQLAEDQPHLELLTEAVQPTPAVTIREMVVWVNGREYTWHKERMP